MEDLPAWLETLWNTNPRLAELAQKDVERWHKTEEMNKEKLISEFASKMVEVYIDRDRYSRGKIIDLAKEVFAEVVDENCNIPIIGGQRELLKAFENKLMRTGNLEKEIHEQDRDDFIKAFNCA